MREGRGGGGSPTSRTREALAQLRQRAVHRGLRALGRRRLERHMAREHVARLLRKLGVELVLDVGANGGQFGASLRAAGFRGRIVSFEPVPIAFARLEARCGRDPLWSAMPYALGREHGSARIHLTGSTLLSSFHAPTDFARATFGEGARVRCSETVPVRTLEELMPTLGLEVGLEAPSRRIFLKLDTQGHDLEVVAGAGRALRAVVALQSELAVSALYEGVPDYLEALARYRELGFEVTGFFPIFSDRRALVIRELDAVLARRELCEADPRPIPTALDSDATALSGRGEAAGSSP